MARSSFRGRTARTTQRDQEAQFKSGDASVRMRSSKYDLVGLSWWLPAPRQIAYSSQPGSGCGVCWESRSSTTTRRKRCARNRPGFAGGRHRSTLAKHQGEQEQGKEQAKAEAGRLKASTAEYRVPRPESAIVHYFRRRAYTTTKNPRWDDSNDGVGKVPNGTRRMTPALERRDGFLRVVDLETHSSIRVPPYPRVRSRAGAHVKSSAKRGEGRFLGAY